MIWISDQLKACTYFNKQWLDFTGREMQQELGEGWTSGVHPDDYEYCLQTYNSNFDQRTAFEMEYRLRRNDGEYRWVIDSGTPRFSSDGVFLGYIGSCIDITERKQAEVGLRGAHEELNQLWHYSGPPTRRRFDRLAAPVGGKCFRPLTHFL